MRSARYALLAVAACLLTAPTTAHAAWKHDRAVAIGEATWSEPCTEVSISYETHADWDSWWAYSNGCDVKLNDDPPVAWNWPIYCTTIIHELGHAAGQSHSLNPRAVMYPNASYVIVNDEVEHGANWRCRDRGRPFLESRGLLAPLAKGSGGR